MSQKKLFLGMIVGIGVLSGAYLGNCADQPVAAAPSAPVGAGQSAAAAPVMDEKMQEMMKYTMPGEQHKVLESLAGNWSYTMKWWMKADAPPEESQGTTENKMILGGRFLSQETRGTAMGQPFEGIGLTGYDLIKGEYSSVWLDNMSTGIMKTSAQYDATTKTFSEQGSVSCPMTGEKERSFRAVMKLVDNDHYSYEWHMNDEAGKEFKSMEISYSRVK